MLKNHHYLPEQKCPPCIAPKVQVSAGLCQKCPPCPACPPPKRCPEPKCPEPKPCPEPLPCPAPKPCPTMGEQKTCSEIKYIKVPTVITKIIKVDTTGKVVSKEIQTDSPNIPEPEPTKQQQQQQQQQQDQCQQKLLLKKKTIEFQNQK